jgi:HlyD family secretion protein
MIEQMQRAPRPVRSWAFIISGVSLVATLACGRGPSGATKPEAAGPEATQVPLVEALEARRGKLPLEVRLSGVVRARNQVEIRPELAAVVTEVLVRSGDAVEKGQPLVRLEPAPQQQELRHGQASVELADAAVSAARARLTELEAQASRTRKLADKAMVSQLELETHEAQTAAARASLEQALARGSEARATVGLRRSSLGKTVVRAPIAGRVGQRGAEVGLLVTPATVLFMIGDLSHVIVDVPLTEKMLARVRVGQPVALRGPALGDTEITAKLSGISPFLAAGSFSTTGEIDVPNPDARLLPGMFLTADIAVGESEATTLVPVSALYEDPRTGLIGVYVVEPAPGAGKTATNGPSPPLAVKLRPIELRAEGRATVGVGGLEPGTLVVTLGQHLLAAQAAKQARVRMVAWDRVLELQARQQEDLLAKFLEKQQRLARTKGATPPRTEEVVGRAPGEAASTVIR